MRVLTALLAALIVLTTMVAGSYAQSTPTPTRTPTATPTPEPPPGPDLEDVDAVLAALLGDWSYVGPVSGRVRTVSILPNGFMAWNTDPNSIGWEYYASAWTFWTYDREAILVLNPEEGFLYAWEIQEWDDIDVLVVNWVEEGEEDAIVELRRLDW